MIVLFAKLAIRIRFSKTYLLVRILVKIFHPLSFLCLLLLGCASSPTTRVNPYSWDDPYWKAQNYESKDPESVIVKEGDLKRNYRKVAMIWTTLNIQ